MTKGIILAAPASGSGKTTLTLGILRALRDTGLEVAAAKSGPDYIDPRFHDAACGGESVNLDAWAMQPSAIQALAGRVQGKLLIIEGAMGLFDGAPPHGKGATADLAQILELPVVLIVDASHQAQSLAALVQGFARHRQGVHVAGVILNKIGSPRHEAMIRAVLDMVPILGAIPRDARLALPSRHLGLVQAGELAALEQFIAAAANMIADEIDLQMLRELAADIAPSAWNDTLLPPLGQRIAIAKDHAFSFTYQHILQSWQNSGASIHFFSPLADEVPDPSAEAIFLPGGYPELHAGKLANAARFKTAMRQAAARGTAIYGECGGYMVLGEGLVDANNQRHEMLGLLRLETSFATRKLHLGYRRLQALRGPWQGQFNGHEYHYSTTLKAEGEPLFAAQNAEGDNLGPAGLVQGSVCGSFVHLIAKGQPA